MRSTRRNAAGFTLVEILIVVIILGILAAIVIPQFSSASEAARGGMLIDDLRVIRTQIGVFTVHHSVPPGYPSCNPSQAPTEDAFIEQMTKSSKKTGETADPYTAGFPYGPYLREMPVNPVNGKTSVQVIADGGDFPSEADDSHGWIYKPETGTFKTDATGSGENGKAFFDY